MTLNETVAAIADAIREKTGKSELIKPIDFAEEIKGITSGGGEGGSDLEYLDLSGLNEENFGVVTFSSLLKIKNAGKIGIGQTGLLIDDFDEVLAGAFAKELRMWIGDSMVTSIKDLLPLTGLSIDYDAIPRLTKEQFYDLNA